MRDLLALNQICLFKLDEHETDHGLAMNAAHLIPCNTCDVIASLNLPLEEIGSLSD